jgi:HEAT repeat protein
VTRKKWMLRVGLGAVLVLAAVGAWAAMNATALKARYTARQLRTATTDDNRAKAADRLVGLGDHGLAKLIEFVRAGDDSCRAAAVGAIDRHLAALPDDEPRAGLIAANLLDAFPGCDDAGRRAILELLPTILKRTGQTHAARCRETIVAGLRLPDPSARVLAVRLALHPDLKMRSELLPLLDDPEAEVRCAALVAVASPTDGDPIISDEDLFRWLHDPDDSVRKICRDVLVSRDRSEAEIALGRRLTDPDPGERLKLLLDLRYDDDVADPEPWLERMSRDIEPAVRAGAARVAVELTTGRRQSCPQWVVRVADADPDPTVRRVARYFRSVPLRSAAGELQPAGGP